MKKLLLYILTLALLFAVISFPADAAADTYTYSDGYAKIGDVVIPFPEYMPGAYFTKNGKACTCHDNVYINCVASGEYCNCIRFINIDGTEVDLLSVQCIGFARYCFYRLFGFTDTYQNTSLFHNVGTIEGGYVTETSVKSLITKLKPGAHIRFKLAYTEHSIVLLSQNDDGFTVYQCNSGGNGIPNESCIISTKTYTWESFASYAYRGVVFANMPNVYPDNVEGSDKPFDSPYKCGKYTTTDNLKLRSGNGTNYEWIDTLPKGATVTVNKVSGVWGMVNWNGKTGWISLEYASYLGLDGILLPKANSGIFVKDGFVYGVSLGCTEEKLLASFENEGLITSCIGSENVGTGTTITQTQADGAENVWTLVVTGDTNGDGILNTSDCLNIKAELALLKKLEGAYFAAADINGNGICNTTDYKLLTKLLTE